MKTGKKDRINWIDFAKGIGIFLVVLGHTNRGIHAANLMDTPQFQTVDKWIYSFHMPLFFFLSGIFAERLQKLNIGDFLFNRFSVLIAPYVIWATIQLVLQASLSRYTNSVVELDSFQWFFVYSFFSILVSLYSSTSQLDLLFLAFPEGCDICFIRVGINFSV